MLSTLNIILLVLGLCFYIRKPIYAVYLYTLWCTIIAYIFDALHPIKYEDTYAINLMADRFIWMCGVIHLYTLFKNKFKLYKIRELILFSALFFIYIYILGITRGVTRNFYDWILGYFAFIPIWIIIMTEKLNLSIYEKYIRWILYAELLIGVFQWFGIGYASYVDLYSGNGLRTISGTFLRYNAYAENLSLLLLSYILIVFKRSDSFRKKELLVCIFAYMMVFLSGARAQSAALLFSIIVFVYQVIKEKSGRLVWMTFIGIGLLIIANVALSSRINNQKSESTIDRQLSMLGAMDDRSYLTEESTLSLSYLLFYEYIKNPESYLTGPGKLFTSKTGYQGIVCVGGVMYDSDFMLYVCETGAIGLFFLLLFLFMIIKSCDNKYVSLSFAMFLFLVSFTDYGIFEGAGAVYMFYAINYINRNNRLIQNRFKNDIQLFRHNSI